jgi:hypothetical protein
MDPNYFTVDWERLGEVLLTIIVFAFFIERALSPLFESRYFIKRYKEKSVKEVIAVILGVTICWMWKFDALSFVIPGETTTIPGYFITGAIIAGGSKASVKLFRDIMGAKSTAQDIEDEAHKRKIKLKEIE